LQRRPIRRLLYVLSGELLLQGPAAAAIANALFDATGVRLREYPLTPKRVLAALKGA
jgi:CO/xanthine dehydrogenase Mo-binding subunit